MASEPKGILRVPAWYDGTNDALKALVNDNGYVPVSIEEQNINLDTQLHVYDSSAWVKSPIIFGYTDRWCEQKNDSGIAAGDHVHIFDAVPAGYIYVVNMTGSYNSATAIDHQHFFYDTTANYIIKYYVAQAAGVWAINDNIWYILKAGDRLKIKYWGCSLNDAIYSRAWGYKMKVDM